MKRILTRFTLTIWLLHACAFGQQADNKAISSKPEHYFSDFASLVSFEMAEKLNQQLVEFDRQTSNQILVVIYPHLPAETTVEDFAEDAFRAWKPGQQGLNNGAILFIFVKERKLRIQTGYGLEGALSDSICVGRDLIFRQLQPTRCLKLGSRELSLDERYSRRSIL